MHHGVVHHGQAGVAPDDELLRRHLHQRREQLAQLRQALQVAVVTAVGAVGGPVRRGQFQQIVGEVELARRRLSPGEVEREPSLDEVGVVTLGGHEHLLRFCVAYEG
ncbi:hypothetical protein GCM10020220_100740 [Nonomuraea rubra]